MGERGWVSALQHAKDEPQAQHDLLRLALDSGTTTTHTHYTSHYKQLDAS